MKLNASVQQTPLCFSLLQETKPSANVLSTVKKAEKEEGLILRIYNPTEKEVVSSFTLKTEYKDIFLCQLNENIICPLEMKENTISICIKPNQVQTILIK